MQNEKPKTTEYSESWDSGTYQTGSAKPRNEHRGLIAVLMIMVTFLGGIASALGIVNIRLLQELAQKEQAPNNVSVYRESSQDSVHPENPANVAAPSLPSQTSVDFQLEEETGKTNAGQLSPGEILEQNRASVVSVHCGSTHSEAVACGVIVDECGFIVTNAYPISDGEPIYVGLSDGRYCRATLVGADEFTDLAVLYIAAENLTAAQFASAGSLKEGDSLACICAQWQISEGTICSSINYSIGDDTIFLLLTDLDPISGPVYNASGKIVGFSSPFLLGECGNMAIPSTTVKEVVEQIIAQGTILGRPCLGVELEEVQPLHQQYWQLPDGLRVTRIPNEESRLAGLMQGDILISLDGHPISDRESLCCVLRTLRAGDRVVAVVVRDNVEMTLELTIQLTGENE